MNLVHLVAILAVSDLHTYVPSHVSASKNGDGIHPAGSSGISRRRATSVVRVTA